MSLPGSKRKIFLLKLKQKIQIAWHNWFGDYNPMINQLINWVSIISFILSIIWVYNSLEDSYTHFRFSYMDYIDKYQLDQIDCINGNQKIENYSNLDSMEIFLKQNANSMMRWQIADLIKMQRPKYQDISYTIDGIIRSESIENPWIIDLICFPTFSEVININNLGKDIRWFRYKDIRNNLLFSIISMIFFTIVIFRIYFKKIKSK